LRHHGDGLLDASEVELEVDSGLGVRLENETFLALGPESRKLRGEAPATFGVQGSER
jgi:hypothetical protein